MWFEKPSDMTANIKEIEATHLSLVPPMISGGAEVK